CRSRSYSGDGESARGLVEAAGPGRCAGLGVPSAIRITVDNGKRRAVARCWDMMTALCGKRSARIRGQMSRARKCNNSALDLLRQQSLRPSFGPAALTLLKDIVVGNWLFKCPIGFYNRRLPSNVNSRDRRSRPELDGEP